MSRWWGARCGASGTTGRAWGGGSRSLAPCRLVAVDEGVGAAVAPSAVFVAGGAVGFGWGAGGEGVAVDLDGDLAVRVADGPFPARWVEALAGEAGGFLVGVDGADAGGVRHGGEPSCCAWRP